MGEDPLPQVTNDPDMDMNMGGDLEHPDPVLVEHPEPEVLSREKVRGINAVKRILC